MGLGGGGRERDQGGGEEGPSREMERDCSPRREGTLESRGQAEEASAESPHQFIWAAPRLGGCLPPPLFLSTRRVD